LVQIAAAEEYSERSEARFAAADHADSLEERFAAMSPEEIRNYEIDVKRRIANLALIPPKINTSPLPEYDYDQLDYGMTIGIERTPGGRLWSAWVAGGDNPKAFMLLAISDDDGEIWSKPLLVIDSHSKNLPADRSVIVGTLWTDPLGRLWFFFDQSMNHFDGRGGLWFIRCGNPDGQNPEWSKPERIWHGSMLNKPTVLSTGEWLLPVQLLLLKGFGPFGDIFKELDPYRGANVFISKSMGNTWERRANVVFPNPDWIEHMIIERKDGSLWMLARTKTGIMQSTSDNQGRTWAMPSTPEGIRNPNARFHICRLTSGRLLMVKHGDTMDDLSPIRQKLKAFLSEDDGSTWKGGLMIDERVNVSYPDGIQAPDGTIYISYDYERAKYGHILMARITEEDVLAGKLVNPRSKLGMLICQPLKNVNNIKPLLLF